MALKVEIRNLDQVISEIERKNKKIEDLATPMREAGKIALAAVKSYPVYGNWRAGQVTSAAIRPNSKYKRTFSLQRSWNGRTNVAKKGRSISYTIYQKSVMNGKKNAKEYMPYVQGDEQTAVHSRWWRTLDSWNSEFQVVIERIFRDYLSRI